MKLAEGMRRNETIIVTLSGRGDKDVEVMQKYIALKGNKDKEKRIA
jgi:tryptophan synthase beta subunit